MPMESAIQELKQARQAKRLSLQDVSDATLINLDFLKAIEEGKTDILPQTYVRAFIREYAAFVGLDPAEVMRKYDEQAAPAPDQAPAPAPVAAEVVHPEPAPQQPPTQTFQEVISTPATTRIAVAALVLIGVGVVLWNLMWRPPPDRIPETPFEAGSPTAASPDSLRSAPAAPIDSLVLSASVADTVWVQIRIDDRAPMEYYFRAGARKVWKAKDRFVITAGNAGAIDLTLNTVHIGTLGKRGAVARNVELGRHSVKTRK
jgi:hypothetical protein